MNDICCLKLTSKLSLTLNFDIAISYDEEVYYAIVYISAIPTSLCPVHLNFFSFNFER